MSVLKKEEEEKIISLISSEHYCELGYGETSVNDEVNEYIESLGYNPKLVYITSWGGEGKGDDIGAVLKFEDIDLYFRIDGYYASHYGADFDDKPYIVRPKEKIITVYE